MGNTPSELEDFSLQIEPDKPKIDLNTMSQGELVRLRGQIDAKITGKSLHDVNLVQEALFQLVQARELQEKASTMTGVPLNQRAQVQNSIKSIISELASVQTKLYDSEYLKRLEAAIIRVVKTLPQPQQAQFFELMDREAEQLRTDMGDEPESANEQVPADVLVQ